MLSYITVLFKALLIFFLVNLFLSVSSSQKPLVVQKFFHYTVLWFVKINVNVAFTLP